MTPPLDRARHLIALATNEGATPHEAANAALAAARIIRAHGLLERAAVTMPRVVVSPCLAALELAARWNSHTPFETLGRRLFRKNRAEIQKFTLAAPTVAVLRSADDSRSRVRVAQVTRGSFLDAPIRNWAGKNSAIRKVCPGYFSAPTRHKHGHAGGAC